MRMRRKPNLIPRMERCAHVLDNTPEEHRGKWRETYSVSGELHLEIGCGKGRFTAELAALMPDTLFVAVEKVPEAIVVAMERVCDSELKNVRFIDKDAKLLPELFADGEISRIYLNFSDPWPKSRAAKHRLTAPGFLALYSKVLPLGGEIHFKTDNVPLFEWSLEQFDDCKWELRELTRDLHEKGIVGVMTDYEEKFHAQGIRINRVVAVKTEETKCE